MAGARRCREPLARRPLLAAQIGPGRAADPRVADAAGELRFGDDADHMADDAPVTADEERLRDRAAALADHWEHVADLEMPAGGDCSLLAFARHVLLEPVVGACALIWSTLEATASTAGAEATITWDEWSPVTSGDGSGVVAVELDRLGRSAQHVPADADDAARLLASARAALLGCNDGPALVAASILQVSGWPGPTDIIVSTAAQAVDGALRRIDDVDPETDNDELVDLIQTRLMPSDQLLIGWARNASFGTLSDPAGSSRTGAEMLHDAADRLIWSLTRAAVEVAAAKRRRSLRTDV